MFKSLYLYWNNTTDTPFIQSKLNMFLYVNIRIFKIKLGNYISLAINSLNSLKYKQIKVYYNVLSFEYLYFKFLTSVILLYVMLLFL